MFVCDNAVIIVRRLATCRCLMVAQRLFRAEKVRMNSRAIFLIPAAVAALLLASCDQNAPTAPAPSPAASTAAATTNTTSSPAAAPNAAASLPPNWTPDPAASLSASPNPVPAGAVPGTTTLTWSTSGRPTAALYVSTNGGPEVLFAEGSQSSSEANWIATGNSYEFRLYTGTDRNQLLARLTVVRDK